MGKDNSHKLITATLSDKRAIDLNRCQQTQAKTIISNCMAGGSIKALNKVMSNFVSALRALMT
jgi:hypothetical protein